MSVDLGVSHTTMKLTEQNDIQHEFGRRRLVLSAAVTTPTRLNGRCAVSRCVKALF
jgi:hypothetical protein